MLRATDVTLPVGTLFQGGYEVAGELGAGSFGRVYRARQLSTGQEVAIKILRFRPEDRADDVTKRSERFRREMRLGSELWHPNIVRLLDSGESAEGVLYAVFELVPGANLRDVLADEGRLSPEEAVHLLGQVLDALSCAHARGIVHRDLKPANIMVTRTGARRNAMVLDFGLGGITREVENLESQRLTSAHELMGTPCYAAPEQLRGEPPTTRSDLYAWGLILLECLTGELAVRGASGHEVLLKQLGPDPIAIPAWLEGKRIGRVLEIVTAKPVERRDATAEGLLRLLDVSDIAGLGAPAKAPPTLLPRGEKRQMTLVSCRFSAESHDGLPLDPEESDEILRAQHDLLAETASRSGGQLASAVGQRAILVFGYPQAREDDARRAVRTALAIVGSARHLGERLAAEHRVRLDVAIGVHTGVLVARSRGRESPRLDDLLGAAPQTAMQLDQAARPGEVLASAETARLLRGHCATEPVDTAAASALAPDVAAFRVVDGAAPSAGLESVARAVETPLVGRSEQLARLREGWLQAEAGRGRALLVLGEAGIGKSRLVRELRRSVPAAAWLEARCIAEEQDSPLRPVAELLLRAGEPLEVLLERHGLDVTQALPLLAPLLGASEDMAPPVQLSTERAKEMRRDAILALLFGMAAASPLVVAIEDVHWADPTTIELLGLLAQELANAQGPATGQPPRVLLLLTARPDFAPPWQMGDLSLLPIPRLAGEDVESMVAAGLGARHPVPRVLLDEVVRRADGIPLFVEEVTRVLAASGGGMRGALGPAEAEVPATLRDLLAARLDTLPTGARETAQLAAALGREFRFEVLRAVSTKEEVELREDLFALGAAQLVYRRRSAASETYVFKHALLRDAAYETMLRPVRAGVHGRIAHTLRERFPEIAQHRPETLAPHFEGAGQKLAAAAFWLRAGERATARGAHAEAGRVLERGLALLGDQPPSPERDQLEIRILTALGTALFSTRGYAAREVERTFDRARVLCEQLGEEIPIPVLIGIWNVHSTRSDRAATAALLPRFERLLAEARDPIAVVTGHAVLGVHAFHEGRFADADAHLTPAQSLYAANDLRLQNREQGYDPGLYGYAYGMVTAWQLGDIERAERLCRELTALAEESQSPYSRAIALGYGATLAHDRGDYEAALAMSDQVSALALEQRLYLWFAAGSCGRGGALVHLGRAEEGIGHLRQGLNLYRTIGVAAAYTYYLTYLAAGYLTLGQPDEGLGVVEEGLALCDTLVARYHQADLLRLKGELHALRGETEAAEGCLRAALDLARRQGGRSFELRAATALARLLAGAPGEDAARGLLEQAYRGFREGQMTMDVRTAAELLAQPGGLRVRGA